MGLAAASFIQTFLACTHISVVTPIMPFPISLTQQGRGPGLSPEGMQMGHFMADMVSFLYEKAKGSQGP